MPAKVLDGKSLAAEIQSELTYEVAEFIQNNSVTPALDVVIVGEDPASQVYVRNKKLACEKVGIIGRLHKLPATTTTDELLELIAKLNRPRGDDQETHGILVQLPLPDHIDQQRILDAVAAHKDVDAFHPENVGLLVQGRPRFLPCTPHGVQQILVRNGIEIAGKHVVVIGRSEIVGKPMANMLVQKGKGADATVTICHSRTKNLKEITLQADILIAAIGRAKFVTAEMVKPGAVVIDVGINRDENGKLCGDVDYVPVSAVASAITPVPGGIGPLTVAMLLKNTLKAAKLDLLGE